MANERESTIRGNVPGDPDRLDRKVKLLASRERRTILDHFLTAETESATVEVLSCKLARLKAENDDGESPTTGAARARLHHVHLPKLADADLVEYDARSGVVRYRSDEQVETIVEFLAEL